MKALADLNIMKFSLNNWTDDLDIERKDNHFISSLLEKLMQDN
jgi:hypothetical protein